MQTENRRTSLHAVHAPLRIFRPTHVNRSDEPMEEGYAWALCRVAEGDVFDFVRTPYRTLKQNRGTSARWSAPKIRQIGLTKITSTVADGIDSVGAVRYQHAGTG